MHLFLRFALILCILESFACSQAKPTGDDAATTGSSIDTSVSPSGDSAAFVFPHPTDWKLPAKHGTWAFQNGTRPCLSCHKSDTGVPGGAPACRSCHASYPHSSRWADKTGHGLSVLQNGVATCQSFCHGEDLKGGFTGISCNKCHASYPHDVGWKDPKKHGVAAKGAGKEPCRNCHGQDFLGGDVKVSCYGCHPSFPHAPSWALKENHGIQAIAVNNQSCQSCHGSDLQGGSSGVSCTQCHAEYPHAKDWKQGIQHGVAAKRVGLARCQACHGSDLSGGDVNVSCRSCHSTYPHPSGWASPSNHGRTATATNSVPCKMCHGSDLKGGLSGVSCNTCHNIYPHVPGWRNPSQHGVPANGSGKNQLCASCHGADLRGGNTGVSCFTCHALFPHSANWKNPSVHGAFVLANGKQGCATQCHGTNFAGGLSGVSCSSCHGTTYPHPTGWVNGTVHGTNALRVGLAVCQQCHGQDFSGGNTRVSCMSCHPSYPHPQGWKQSINHGAQAVATAKEPCKLCHGQNLQGGISGVSCLSCHPDYPHQTGWVMPGARGRAGNQHVAAFVSRMMGAVTQPNAPLSLRGATNGSQATNLTACQDCHGVNYDRVKPVYSSSGTLLRSVACTTCHTHNGNIVTHKTFPATSVPRAINGMDARSCPTVSLPGDGVTAVVPWRMGCQHGLFYSSNSNGTLKNKSSCAVSETIPPVPGLGTSGATWDSPPEWDCPTDGYCKDCHNKTVNFTQSQVSQNQLSAQSDCYACHWAYPHKGYTWPQGGIYKSAPWYDRASSQLGHLFYVGATGANAPYESPLLVTSANVRPFAGFGTSDPNAIPAAANSCGGGSGTCHFRETSRGATRGDNLGNNQNFAPGSACSYCHSCVQGSPLYPLCRSGW